MCDTFVAMGSMTQDGSVIFGKNSDRDCNEPQVVLRQSRKKYDLALSPMVQATYIQIPQVEETYEVVLSKPNWMWGCEMAFNEFGVVIGNEAVFTKEKLDKPALTGMDMVRLAAERCASADEALDCIIQLLDTYGQGGNCGYQSSLEYHNGFLIADRNTAWILETAGKFWAAKKVQDFGVISNGLSIGSDFDRCHPLLVQNALDKGYCKNQAEFHFAKDYSKHIYAKATHFKQRRCLAGEALLAAKGSFSVQDARALLRLHTRKQDKHEFCSGSMESICMHAGGVVSSQTTSSLIARLGADRNDYYFTACSIPCISLFKPFWMESRARLWTEDNLHAPTAYWKKRESLHRMILAGRIRVDEHRAHMRKYEKELDDLVATAQGEHNHPDYMDEVIAKCFELEEHFISDAIKSASPSKGQDTACGGPVFKSYWKKANKNMHAGRTVK